MFRKLKGKKITKQKKNKHKLTIFMKQILPSDSYGNCSPTFLHSSDHSVPRADKRNKLPFYVSSLCKAIISPVENALTCVRCGEHRGLGRLKPGVHITVAQNPKTICSLKGFQSIVAVYLWNARRRRHHTSSM